MFLSAFWPAESATALGQFEVLSGESRIMRTGHASGNTPPLWQNFLPGLSVLTVPITMWSGR